MESFGNNLSPMPRQPVAKSIVEMITGYLLNQQLKPGDKLPTEMEFANQLGVGRNSVREAVKMLSSLGVVEIKRGVGTFIAQELPVEAINPLVLSLVFQQGPSEELAEMRTVFETGLAGVVVAKVTPDDLAELRRINQDYLAEAERNPADQNRLKELNQAFHRRYIAITNNAYLIKMGMAVYTLYSASTEKVVGTDHQRVFENHNRIIELLADKDSKGLILHLCGMTEKALRS